MNLWKAQTPISCLTCYFQYDYICSHWALGVQKYEIICKLIEFDETWYNMCLGIIYESPEISDLYLMSNMLFSKGLFCYMLFSKGLVTRIVVFELYWTIIRPWAFWNEARKGFDVHKCIYTNGHWSPCGLRDASKGIGVRQVSVLKTT